LFPRNSANDPTRNFGSPTCLPQSRHHGRLTGFLSIIDAQGRIRHHHFGEGSYERSERVIQQLLAEAGSDGSRELVSVDAQGAEVAADWDK
jgi:hypothetical protein